MILRRLFRVATRSAFGRAYALRSAKWLSVAVGLTLLRIIDHRAARPRKTTRKS
ncbi:MAG TPA: hypothetical protein VMV96_01345 [Acidimicrobiales bacterium]|nr:hypothetical protein [Acidimicrobiales bacterium]